MIVRVFALCAVLFAGAAYAAERGADDVVVLNDGTMLRGHVAEMKPGEMVTLVLHTGQTRVIAWSQIRSTSGPSFPSESATVDERDDNYLAPGPGKVPVRVESTGKRQDVGVVEGAISAGYLSIGYGREVCRTPCTMYVRPGELTLHTSGPGLVAHNEALSIPPGGLAVRVRAASAWGRFGGVMLISLGAAAILTGAIMMGLAPVMSSTNGDDTNTLIGGGATLGAGALLTSGGIVLLVKNRSGVAEEQPLPAGVQPGSQLQVRVAPTGLRLTF